MSAHSFKTSLRIGDLGEVIFYEAHCKSLIREDGRKRDFTDKSTGTGIELKTDYYRMDATPNFFFERYSDKDAKKPGGPWQSQANGTDVFIYFFVSNLTYFEFETAALVDALEGIIPELTPTPVQNSGWTTVGYRVPRELLKGLYSEVKISASVKRKGLCQR